MRGISKQLITKNNVELFLGQDKKTLYLKSDMILTPGAKDLLRNLAVTIKYGEEPVAQCPLKPCQEDERTGNDEAETIKQIIKLLRDDFNIEEASRVTMILKRVLEKL